MTASGWQRRQLLLAGLATLGATRLAQAADLAVPAADLSRELELRRAESLLLNRKVDLRGLGQLRGGRLVVTAEPPVARLLILHIWSVECRPCVEEFPILRRITDSLRDLPQVQVALVSETVDVPRLQGFLSDHRGELPRADSWVSLDDRLRASLQNRTLPATLLLDSLAIVRQAMLGSLKQRRSELVDALLRLAKL
jgi:hypothetical protein